MSSEPAIGEIVMRAACNDCDWTYERSLEAGDGLTEEQNQEIAHRVIRNHKYKCHGEWGDVADVGHELTQAGGRDE